MTYITGNTFGNTTEPSAKYWYRIRISSSSEIELSNVSYSVYISRRLGGISEMPVLPFSGIKSE
jgi:hypothetical protein